MKKTIPFILLISLSVASFACSIFTYVGNDHVYFCGNEDWSSTDPAFITVPAEKDDYGVILMGWKSYLPRYPQAGVNSEGLCFDWASVPSQSHKNITSKQNLSVNDTLLILQKCATVSEVISFLEDYNFPNLASEHIMFTDRTGMSCVIEYTNEERKVITSDKGQYITNFNLTDKEKGWYPCDRFSKLEAALKPTQDTKNASTKKVLHLADLEALLDDVHQINPYATQYSYIVDLTEMKFYFYKFADFENKDAYNIEDLLKTKHN